MVTKEAATWISDQMGEEVHSKEVVFMHFYADWCEPCQTMEPIISYLETHWSRKIIFLKINVDENPGLTRQYHIYSIPAYALFIQGNLVWKQAGLMTRYELERQLEHQLDKG